MHSEKRSDRPGFDETILREISSHSLGPTCGVLVARCEIIAHRPVLSARHPLVVAGLVVVATGFRIAANTRTFVGFSQDYSREVPVGATTVGALLNPGLLDTEMPFSTPLVAFILPERIVPLRER